MIKEAECSLKIPQTFCQVHTERSVLSVCLDQDCPYRGMFCYQCIKYHYQHLDKTFEIKEFLNLISENINDLSFNMLPTSPSPSLKDIYKNKFDQLQLNKENLLRQKELVIEAVCKYVDLAIENAENKVDTIETKNPASQDTQSLQELTTYQEKFFDLANLQPDELYDLLIYFSKFIHKEDDKIEIVNYSPSNGQIPKSQSLMIENDLDNTSQNLRNSELVLQKLTGILDHLPPDDRSAHQKLSCLKIAPQQTPRRFGQPVTFQPNPNPSFGGYNNTYHHNSISLSNHFQRASSNQGNNQGNQMNNMNNYENNHNNHSRGNHFSNNNNNYQNQTSSNNSGQNGNKFTHYTNNNNNNKNSTQKQNNTQQANREKEESSNNNISNNNNNNVNNNSNQVQSQQNAEGGENSNSGASSFLQKFQQKLNENSKNQTESQQNSQSNSNNSTAQSSQQNSQNSQSSQQQQTNSNKGQPGTSQANITKLQNLVQQSNAQMAQSNSQSQQIQGFASLAQHFQQSSQQQNSNNQSQNDTSRMSYQQKKQQLANQKRNELFSEQRLALRSVEHFCDCLEVGYNTAWCISFRTQKECALNGVYHMPIFVYDSTVGVSLETAYLQLSLFEGNSSFSKKLYEQSFLLKKTNKHISPDESNLMNVLEKLNLNTSYKLRKNSDYTIVVRNKTSDQEDPSNLKQLYILYGDDQAEDLKNQPESEGSKLVSFIKTNTNNLSTQLENTKLITQNNESLEDPQLTDYFIPYLSISHLSQEQQHYKNNFYSSTNQTGEDGVLQSLQENDQKTPKRTEYEHNHLGNHYNGNNQTQRGFKDFMNNFKVGNGLGAQSSSQHGNNQNNENDFNKYSSRNNQTNNKRKYLGGEGSQSSYNNSRSNNSNHYSNNQSSSYQQSSSYSNNNNYEKSSIIPGFVPQKKQKK